MVSAAYLRIIGHTQKETATAVGRSERRIRDWENSVHWPGAQAEARARWLDEAGDAARRAVLKSISAGNAMLGMDLLSRIEPALSGKQKVEHSGIPAQQVNVHVNVTDQQLFRTRQDAIAKAFGVG